MKEKSYAFYELLHVLDDDAVVEQRYERSKRKMRRKKERVSLNSRWIPPATLRGR